MKGPHDNRIWRTLQCCFGAQWSRVIFGLAAYSATAYASNEPRFVTRSWSVEQGLPHNAVNRVVQDSRGFLWVGSGAGLVRFDGLSFEEIHLPGRAIASATNIRDLRVESDGSLLVLAATGEILVWKSGVFSVHPATAAMAGRTVLEIYSEPMGALWIGTSTGEVARWEKGKTQIFGPAEGILRRVNRTTFVTDRRGETWVASGDFIGSYSDGSLKPAPPALSNIGRAVVIAPTASGGLWVSTADQLLKVEDGRVIPCVQDEWPAKRTGINVMLEDHRGNLWIGTRRNGLYLYSGGKLTPVNFEPRTVFSLLEDRDGNIWAGTSSGGLCRLRPLAFTLLNRESGLLEDLSSSVTEDFSGAIWCANRSGGLIRWKDGVIQHVAEEVRAARFPTRVAPDQKGNLWIAAGASRILRMPIDHPEEMEPLKPEFHSIQALFGTREGDMLVASASGLGVYHGNEYQPLNGPDGLFTAHVSALAQEAHGSIWLGTTDARAFESESRLWEYADGKIVERISPTKWPAGTIHGMQFDHLGGLWIASSAGLVLKDGERLTRFTTAEGLPDDLIIEILVDDLGFVWCGSRRGFFRIAASDLRAVAAGRIKKVEPTVFGVDDGLRGASALSGGYPTAWKARDGKLWFTTIRGVVGFDPAVVGAATTPPPVFINAVDLDDQTMPPPLERFAVPSGSHRVSFHFSALNYSAPEQVHLRHRLEGFDDDWVETGQARIASYAHLPPGHYQLRVIAANQSGVWNEQGATLKVWVAAAWWQNSWFAVLVVVVLGGLIAWGVRTWSLRKISRRLRALEKEHALERERSRIARNLHDELGGSLTQIGLLADRLKRQTAEGEVQRTLSQLAWRTRGLAGDLESIVWTVSPQNNSWDRLAAFIAQFARRFFKDTSIACTVTGVETIPVRPLSPDAQHEVLALLKESLNNVLKHSKATQVAIDMKLADQAFELSIQDNGIGFTPGLAEHSERNGLSNIRARGVTLGGEALIESRPGEGAHITLRVPLNARVSPIFP